jgi:hypothetical protein
MITSYRRRRSSLESGNQLNEACSIVVTAWEFFCRLENLRRRFALEMEGYENEAILLRKRFAHLQRLLRARNVAGV